MDSRAGWSYFACAVCVIVGALLGSLLGSDRSHGFAFTLALSGLGLLILPLLAMSGYALLVRKQQQSPNAKDDRHP